MIIKIQNLFLCVFILLLASCGGGSSNSGGPSGTNPLGFSKLLGPTFNHERCMNCHGFETDNTKKVIHIETGRITQQCSNCHKTPGWRQPFASFSFSNKSDSQICEAIKNKSGNDLQHLREIMVNSTLARWAIEDGGVINSDSPNPVTYRIATAPPGSMAAFVTLLDQWIAGGATCD